MRATIVLLFVLLSNNVIAQKRNNIWCFGDSTGIDFNGAMPLPLQSSINSRGTCASISDTTGQLLFYSGEDADVYLIMGPPHSNGEIWTKQHQTMQNGDSIFMALWYMEAIIVDNPTNPNQYYVFTIGVTGNYGLFYSEVDMNQNGGLGVVIQKNVQLLPDKATDGLVAVKHGNGRDWWLFFRNWVTTNNTFYKFLISPSGVTGPFTQNIGIPINSGFQRFSFSKWGNKLAMVMYDGLIETYDFDRCTGVLSNHVVIRPKNTSSPYPSIWSCAFSPNDRFLYVSTNQDTSYLIQIDLQDSTPWINADTIWGDCTYLYEAGALRLAPDDKIYLACGWFDGVTYNFPYPDTLFNNVVNNLSLINQPDSPGLACNFAPFSFYLGGGRTYYGLPNNPDYDMKPLYGSACDSLSTGIFNNEPGTIKAELHLTYINAWDKLFINAERLNGKTYTLMVTDITGRLVFKEGGRLRPPYFTKDLDCSSFSKGIYIVSLQTEKEILAKKFVKN